MVCGGWGVSLLMRLERIKAEKQKKPSNFNFCSGKNLEVGCDTDRSRMGTEA